MPATLSAHKLSRAIGNLYADEGLGTRAMAAGRPYIAPIEVLIDLVPRGSTVLDCGCGSGFFLAALALFRDTHASVGFDVNKKALEAARRAAARLAREGRYGFDVRDASSGNPFAGSFDAVSMIDLMHHLPLEERHGFVVRALGATRPGGMFLYKDMARSPRWSVFASQLHDLVLAGQLIRLSPIEDVEALALAEGFEIVHAGSGFRWWYAHEWRLFRRPS